MCTRADYARAFAVVRDVIHGWDPYGLISCGAPIDEWDSEIASLVAQIPRIKSEDDATHALSRVFSSAFQQEGFSAADCSEVGRHLYSSLAKSGLLTDRT